MTIYEIITSKSLLQRLQTKDDTDAWTHLVTLYRQPLLNFAKSRRTFYNIDLEGAVQETLLALMTSISEGLYRSEKGRFRDYIISILKNKLKNELRSHVSRKNREVNAVETLLLHHIPSLEEEEIRCWQEVTLQHAIELLFEDLTIQGRTRSIFTDYVLKNHPVEEVCEAYGVTPNTVYQIKFRLTEKLNEIVKQFE